ncbi:MAG: hypothetical protein PUP90_18110 [Nostoc sp. S4]|nr:hypothetical protein [Nostoc sp. S4]
MQEKYTPGYSSNATNFIANRSLDTHGAFFKPYLRPGMKLLDCSCGSGAIANSNEPCFARMESAPRWIFAQSWCEVVGQKG